MDWLRSGLQAAQKQAQEAADAAYVLAQQASENAQVLAKQAAERAQVLVSAAAIEAQLKLQQAQQHAQQMAAGGMPGILQQVSDAIESKINSVTNGAAAGGGSAQSASPADLAEYGIRQDLIEFVSSLTYSTFSDYPLDVLPATNPLNGEGPSTGDANFKLTPWQMQHAKLVLARVEQLQHLRFALCPRRMTEAQFWILYFTLTKAFMPPEAFLKPVVSVPEPPVFTSAWAQYSASLDSPSVIPTSDPPLPVSSRSSSPLERVSPMPKSSPSKATASQRSLDPTSTATATSSTSGAAADVLQTHGSSSSSQNGPCSPSKQISLPTTLQTHNSTEINVIQGVQGTEGGGQETGALEEEAGEGVASESESFDDEDVDKLLNDPELEKYMQEALNVDGTGDDISNLGSGADEDDLDLDDYLDQLENEDAPPAK